MIGHILILNILGLSRLLFVSRVLEPPRWVYARVNSLVWPFLWGPRFETVARKSITCLTAECFRFERFLFARSSVPPCSSYQHIRRSLLQGLFPFEIFLHADPTLPLLGLNGAIVEKILRLARYSPPSYTHVC